MGCTMVPHDAHAATTVAVTPQHPRGATGPPPLTGGRQRVNTCQATVRGAPPRSGTRTRGERHYTARSPGIWTHGDGVMPSKVGSTRWWPTTAASGNTLRGWRERSLEAWAGDGNITSPLMLGAASNCQSGSERPCGSAVRHAAHLGGRWRCAAQKPVLVRTCGSRCVCSGSLGARCTRPGNTRVNASA